MNLLFTIQTKQQVYQPQIQAQLRYQQQQPKSANQNHQKQKSHIPSFRKLIKDAFRKRHGNKHGAAKKRQTLTITRRRH